MKENYLYFEMIVHTIEIIMVIGIVLTLFWIHSKKQNKKQNPK